MEEHKLFFENWRQVDNYLDAGFVNVTPLYLEQVNQRKYPEDAFSKGQVLSKVWLLHELRGLGVISDNSTIAILGCWVGSIVDFLLKDYMIKRIYGFDLDAKSVDLAEQFNDRHVEDNWKFKGVVADVNNMSTNLMRFETNGELIEVTPEVIINTSCEHMGTEWFETANDEQLIVMQTNNSPDFEGHVNTCSSIEHMKEKYPMSICLFAGEMITPIYTRYMQIGYK